MKINTETKISKIIKHNKKAIDVIASINPHFNKLKNPILRSVLAPRVNIKDAARIGKCKPEDFFEALSKIGFEVENNIEIQAEEKSQIDIRITVAINSKKIETLDVRPILEKNADPFTNIMNAIKRLQDGHALEVINSFEPIPIIKILNNKGYISSVLKKNDIVKTYFLKVSGKKMENKKDTSMIFNVSFEVFENKRANFKSKCKEIDVRKLEMPLPMVTILNEIEELEKDTALYVNHKKVPQYLLPELENKNITTWITEIGEGNVKLLIHY